MPRAGVHLERVHRQLAADDDRRPADADPALVDRPGLQRAGRLVERRLVVQAGVEHAHDLAVDADRPRNPDAVAERRGHALGDARLAVARAAEQEQAAAGVDRRAEPPQHVLVDQQVAETPAPGRAASGAAW